MRFKYWILNFYSYCSNYSISYIGSIKTRIKKSLDHCAKLFNISDLGVMSVLSVCCLFVWSVAKISEKIKIKMKMKMKDENNNLTNTDANQDSCNQLLPPESITFAGGLNTDATALLLLSPLQP